MLNFIRPRNPIKNAYAESFVGRLRNECLNENWFLSLEDAKEKVEEWRQHYNKERHRGPPGNLAPLEHQVA